MDQLFLRDTMQSRTILEMVLRDLPLEDILELKRVTSLSRQIVANHRHPGLVTLCEPHRVDPKFHDGPKVKEGSIASAHPVGGPILPNLCINTLIQSRVTLLSNWDWMLNTLTSRETQQDVERLTLQIVSYSDMTPCKFRYCGTLHSRAEYVLRHAQDLTFTRCTRLSIHIFVIMDFFMTTLLKHFPNLEHLNLKGSYLPLLSLLPAPEKLRTLKVFISVLDFVAWPRTTQHIEPIIINVSSLETLELTFCPRSPNQITQDNEDTALMCRTTGVRWLASLSQHPPTRLEHLTLHAIANWSVPLVALCSRISTVFRSLDLSLADTHAIPLIDQLQHLLVINGERGKLQRITKLTINSIQSVQAVSRLLALTPSLVVLDIWIDWHYRPADNPASAGDDLKRSILSLKSLTRMSVKHDQSQKQNPDWLEAIIQEALSSLTVDVSLVTDMDALSEWRKRTIGFFSY